MKLCRFESNSTPGKPRSGIYYESRIYETDGVTPLGVHDLASLRLLSPVGLPPTIRAFYMASTRQDGWKLAYSYLNPTLLLGPLSTVDVPDSSDEFDFEVSLGIVVKDRGDHIESDEADGFVLGFTIVVVFQACDWRRDEQEMGLPPIHSRDIAIGVGPFLTTPDELLPGADSQRAFSITVNGEPVWSRTLDLSDPAPGALLFEASRSCAVAPGDLLVAPPLAKPALPETHLGRFLSPGDSLAISIDGLDALHLKIG